MTEAKGFPISDLALARMTPQPLWSVFAEMSKVPRQSRHEDKIRAHLREVAESADLKVREDEVGNLIIDVPACHDREKAPVVTLQAHMDMVCVKRDGSPHDFAKDPIQLIADDHNGEPIIRANNTTLGADNGIGVAAAFAAALSDEVAHGPLEILITTNEENGMTGGHGMKADTIRGRWLLNLDAEEDNVFYIGCAGATVGKLTWNFETTPLEGDTETIAIKVVGLRGGHSGADIHLGRGSAIKIAAKMLLDAGVTGLRLVEINGGTAVNSIPDRATIVVAGPLGTLDELEQAARETTKKVREKLGANDPEVEVFAIEQSKADAATSDKDLQKVLKAIDQLPFGPMKMRSQDPPLVETSSNPAQVLSDTSENDRLGVELRVGVRSLLEEELRKGRVRAQTVADSVGAKYEFTQGYPSWEPNNDSKLMDICRDSFEAEFGHPPTVLTIHAGLECGLFAEKIPGIDMVSMGPLIEEPHSPDERVYVNSVERFWKYLVRLLDDLSRTRA